MRKGCGLVAPISHDQLLCWPIVDWLPKYAWGNWLRFDVIAALTIWALLVPEALAYTGIACVLRRAGLGPSGIDRALYGIDGVLDVVPELTKLGSERIRDAGLAVHNQNSRSSTGTACAFGIQQAGGGKEPGSSSPSPLWAGEMSRHETEGPSTRKRAQTRLTR
jgi:hypothetical protein